MGRLLAAVGLVTALLVVPANAAKKASAAKMTFGACKTKVMQDGRNLDTSAPIPKFASFCGTLVCELRNRRALETY